MRTTLVVPTLLFSALLHAQAEGPAASPGGVRWHDGAVRAVGQDYVARFDPGGVTFTPALGARVDVPAALHCRFEHVRRGATHDHVRSGDVPPTAGERQVRYAHGTDLVEVYDVRTEGIERRFVFVRRADRAPSCRARIWCWGPRARCPSQCR
jgi:hypothetical protein